MGVSEWIVWAALGVSALLLLAAALALVVCRALALELSLGLRLVEGDEQSCGDDGPRAGVTTPVGDRVLSSA
jgi:hypothetical protein